MALLGYEGQKLRAALSGTMLKAVEEGRKNRKKNPHNCIVWDLLHIREILQCSISDSSSLLCSLLLAAGPNLPLQEDGEKMGKLHKSLAYRKAWKAAGVNGEERS